MRFGPVACSLHRLRELPSTQQDRGTVPEWAAASDWLRRRHWSWWEFGARALHRSRPRPLLPARQEPHSASPENHEVWPLKDKIAGKLLEANLVSQEQLQQGIELQNKEGGSVGQNLVRTGALSEMAYAEFLGKMYSCPPSRSRRPRSPLKSRC